MLAMLRSASREGLSLNGCLENAGRVSALLASMVQVDEHDEGANWKEVERTGVASLDRRPGDGDVVRGIADG